MQIIPIRDLKNTAEIERRCAQADEPVYVTKNGYGRLVVMDINYYERMMQKIGEAELVNKGIADYEKGHTLDGPAAVKNLREKYGV